MILFASKQRAVLADHLVRLERKISCMKKLQEELPGDSYFNELYVILHRPNWTTEAEAKFFEGAVDSILLQAQHLARQYEQLLSAARAV